jgi:hypothetical protein
MYDPVADLLAISVAPTDDESFGPLRASSARTRATGRCFSNSYTYSAFTCFRRAHAYCWLDERGDVEDVIRIVTVRGKTGEGSGTVIIFKRQILDEWMLLTGSVVVRTFDFTRYRSGGFSGWSDAVQNPQRGEDEHLYSCSVVDPGHAGYVRGCQIVRPKATIKDLNNRFGWREHKNKERGYPLH